MATLIAICLGGLEDQVVCDIARHAPEGSAVSVFAKSKETKNSIEINGRWVDKGEGGCGKVLVKNVSDFGFIHTIRSVQHWLVYVAETANLPSSQEAAIEHMKQLVTNGIQLGDALLAWQRCLSADGKAKYHDIIEKIREPTFCVRCIRDGDHAFTSLDASRKLGEAVLETTKWSVDLCNMDFEIIAFILSETMLIGINIPTLSPPFLKSRLPGEIRPPVIPSGLTSGLRPSTAYLLVGLANPQPGDILVDAMCGCGAAFIEAAYSHSCVAIGGDVDTDLQFTLRESMQLTRDMSKNKAVAEVSPPWSSQ